MNRITAITHSAVKIGFLCCLMMVLGTKIKAQNKGGYEKITIEETDPFGTKAIKDKKKINGSNSLASKHIEIVAKINPLLLFSGEYMVFGEIIFKERIGIEIGLGITGNNRLLQYPYLTGELKSSEIEQYYVLGAVNSDLYNSIPNSATPTINYSTGSAFRIEGRIYLGENNYNDAVGFLSLGIQVKKL
jgi:hypothetical protein